jgi:hypothetical protein
MRCGLLQGSMSGRRGVVQESRREAGKNETISSAFLHLHFGTLSTLAFCARVWSVPNVLSP